MKKMLSLTEKKHAATATRPAFCAPRRAALVLLIGAAYSCTAHAEISDTIHPFIQTTFAYDDNLLRLSEFPGQIPDLGDTSRTVQGGFLFERPVGRQLFTGYAKLSHVSFNRFTELNYNGKDALVDWAWQLGNRWQGHLGTSYLETLAPFTDTNSDQRNLRTQRRSYADATWLFHPSWQVRAGFSRFTADYELPAQQINNRTENATELGLDYLAASGSKVGIQLRQLKSDYQFKGNPLFGLPDNDYTQDEIKANVLWLVSGPTKLSFLGGWVRRTHPQSVSGTSSSGANGRLIADWIATGKLRFNANLWREFQVVEGGIVGSSLNKGASLAAFWSATAKVGLNAQLRHEKRDFSTINGFTALSGLSDSTTGSSLGLTYTPVNNIQLELDAFRDRRSGNPIVGSNTYRAKGVSFSANVQF